ncbi:unnamed protein product [Caenorhabditis angaria]|uniref:Mitochondrial pyruvate carrier n=1 Tax=Caenorhabditis angaria TaxID=860376 RepID=A0A9P1INJ4_9PELO|nr:unnamed protein product [Caenorhabditis angaria]
MGPHRRLYQYLCRFGDRHVYPRLPEIAKPAWNHPAGFKTVFFWAPTFKWILVFVGFSEAVRPAEKLSLNQNLAFAVTGVLWTRLTFQIQPFSWYMVSLNVFVALMGALQCSRIGYYRLKNPDWKTREIMNVN